MILQIDPQAQATIVAALRYYCRSGQGEPSNRSELIHELATAGDKVISLDDQAIRELEDQVRDCRTKVALIVAKDDDDENYVRVFAPRWLDPAIDIEVFDLNDPDTGRCNDRAVLETIKDGSHPDYPDFDEISL